MTVPIDSLHASSTSRQRNLPRHIAHEHTRPASLHQCFETVHKRLNRQRGGRRPSILIKLQKPPHPTMFAYGIPCHVQVRPNACFRKLVASLFGGSNGDQTPGMLNQLISSIRPGNGPTVGGRGSARQSAGRRSQNRLLPNRPRAFLQKPCSKMASHKEKADPSIIDKASAFYAQHPGLVKKLSAVWR